MENRDNTKTKEQLLKDTVFLNAKIARLEKDKEIFQVIAENTSDNIAITSFDLKAEYLYVSPSVKHVLDYDPKDLVGKSFFDFIHPDDKKVLFPLLKKYVNQKIKKLLSGKNIPVSETVDFRFRKKNGDWCFMQSAINIVGNQFLSVTRDITGHKRAEKALKESEKQLQTLIDAMPDFVCFKDGDGCWLKANNACIRIFQLEDIDYRGKTDSELAELNSNLRGTFLTCKETDARAWKGEGVFHGEETVPDPDGSVRVYDMTKVAVLQPGGERIGLVILGHDITERKQAAEELAKHRENLEELVQERTKELEEKNKKLEKFNKLFVDREFRIKELKDKVKKLEGK